MCAQSSMVWEGRTVGDATIAPYDSDEFSDYINDILCIDRTTSGVIWSQNAAYLGNLAVSNPAGLTIRVATGLALVDGKLYRNTAAVDNAIVAPGAGSNYYRFVLRKGWAAQTVRVAVLGPNIVAPPAVTQTDGTTWEISLATVQVTSLGVITVTDARAYIGQEIMSYANTLGAGTSLSIGGGGNTVLGNYNVLMATESSLILGTATDSVIIGGLVNQIGSGSQYCGVIGGSSNTIGDSTGSVIVASSTGTIGDNTEQCACVATSGANIGTGSQNSALIGGNSNTLGDLSNSAILAGADNTINTAASGWGAIIAGFANTINGVYSVIIGGERNDVTGNYSVAMGRNADIVHDHSLAIGGRFFSANSERGTTQMEETVVSDNVTHNSNAWFTLYLDPFVGSGLLTIPTDSVWAFDVLIAGASQGCAKTFAFRILGCIENDGGTTAIKGTPTVTTIDDSDDVSFDAQAVADDPNNALLIQVRDADGTGDTVRWSASVKIAQVVFP